MNNPIPYSAFFQPDSSITDLIKQLEQVQLTYSQTASEIVEAAKKLEASLKKTNNATAEGQEETKKAAEEADKLAKAYENLEKAQSETAKQLAELKRQQTEQSRATKLEVQLAASAEGSYNQLAAQYAINATRLKAMSREQREATDEGKALTKQTKEMFEEMKRLNKEMGPENLAVGSYTDSIKEALGANTKFASSLMDIAENTAGIKGFLSSFVAGAKALGTTLLGLLSNPVFLTIAGIGAAAGAVKFWYDYNKGIAEATKLTAQFTGKTGDDLKGFRNEVQALSDNFGKDFRESLMAVNTISKQFGISQEEALKLVKDGFLAGADANGEFLDNLKEYPAYFKEAGISASQFIAITTQANKSGVYSDKGIDAIKEGNLRIREMTTATSDALRGIGLDADKIQKDLQRGSKTTFQIMQEVSAKLAELPASSKVVGAAIADIFGGPGEDAGLQYLKTLKDIDTNLDSVKGKAGELSKVQEELMASQLRLTNAISDTFDATGGVFETLTAKIKILINDVLAKLVITLGDTANAFGTLKTKFDVLLEDTANFGGRIVSGFETVLDKAKSVGNWIGDLFYPESDKKKAETFAKDVVGNAYDAIRKEVKKQSKVPTIDPFVINPLASKTTTTKTGTTKPKLSAKELEEMRKHNLEIIRKYEDLQTSLETDELEKRRKQILIGYNRQSQDLKQQLRTDTKLSYEGRKSIKDSLIQIEKQKNQDLAQLEIDKQIRTFTNQKNDIQLQLDAAKKGSVEELNLRRDMIEAERKIELAENAKKVTGKQDEKDINKKFNLRIDALKDDYNQIAMLQFDNQQKLAASEFDLLKTSEAEKTRFRLEQEKARLKKILDLNLAASTKLSDTEVATIENTIKKIDKEIEANKKKDVDFYSMVGLKLNDDEKQLISDSTSYAIGQVQEFLQAKVDAAGAAVDAANVEVDAAQKKLDAEVQARQNGYAANVGMAQKELDLAKKNQEKALKEQEKAQKAQKAINTLQQVSSLVTATAGIWSSFAGTGPWGIALALAATALMWGSFAAAKIKASQLTKQEYGEGGFEILSGGSHASGNDIALGLTADGRDRRAEGGEALAIINKSKTRKYRSILPSIIDSLNKGVFEQKYGNSLGLNIAAGTGSDLSTLERDVEEIKNQGQRKYYVDGKGRVVEIYKNLKTVYNAN